MPKTSELRLEKTCEKLFHELVISQIDISKTVEYLRRFVQYAMERFLMTGSHVNKPGTVLKRMFNRRRTLSDLVAKQYLLGRFADDFKKLV
ncbi:hypothetical protein Trydic_g3779 [Trypoxylus dichotomus]